ncbi:MAG: hypothetical protein Q9157_001997 [Trypethelium eluteriae]
MQLSTLLIATILSLTWALPIQEIKIRSVEQRRENAQGEQRQHQKDGRSTNIKEDSDEYIVYPDTDRDEDVVYAYHGINE